ncbi:uncharacterized protein LOC123686558 [Harmonia axyridis]|uniref:uncharacterized protein LOC123686558 n=1 Tax=Harmonia axyridis TaxID=115357 RepID=UPI001E275A47|nr:uncharacterized protein LOC123686558 [Harmonia axyridis]
MVEKEEWDDRLYTNTEITEGKPWEATNTRVVMVEKDDPNMYRQTQAAFKEKFPILSEIRDNFEIVTVSVNRSSKKKERKDRVVKVIYDNNDDQNIWESLVKLKEELAEENSLTINKMKGMSIERQRKMLEVIFFSSITKISIVNENISEKTDRDKKRSKEKMTYAIVVETANNGYKETLKNVKKQFENNPAKQAIRTIRSSRDGKMVITLDKDDEKMKSLKEALNTAPEKIGATCRWAESQKQIILHVRGMDELTTEEEVRTAIYERTGGEGHHFMKISSLRPDRNNTQAITVATSEDVARDLMKEPLKIGLTKCQVEQRIDLEKCFKCWEVGHTANRCKGIDRAQMCHKCGKLGHKSKECPNEEECPICNAVGHRAATSKCPQYKRALGRARREAGNANSLRL